MESPFQNRIRIVWRRYRSVDRILVSSDQGPTTRCTTLRRTAEKEEDAENPQSRAHVPRQEEGIESKEVEAQSKEAKAEANGKEEIEATSSKISRKIVFFVTSSIAACWFPAGAEKASDWTKLHPFEKRRNLKTRSFQFVPTSYMIIWTWVLSVINCIYLGIVQGLVTLSFR